MINLLLVKLPFGVPYVLLLYFFFFTFVIFKSLSCYPPGPTTPTTPPHPKGVPLKVAIYLPNCDR